MTAFDDLTDSSPESPESPESTESTESAAEALAAQPGGAAQTPGEIGGEDQTVDPSGDPGGDSDLGTTAEDMSGQGPGVDGSDQERGNLDGSTPVESSREDALDDAGEAVRDPSEASAENLDGTDLASYSDAGDSGQDNGLNE